MEKKYELTDETERLLGGTILHRIRALRDFGCVHKGDLGGYIEKEENLSHDGKCWVYDDAIVIGSAMVDENAEIYGYACVNDNVMIFGNARIHGYSRIHGNVRVSDSVVVRDNAFIYGECRIGGEVKISKDAWISSDNDYFAIENIGSRNDTTTFYNCGNNVIRVNCGCFNGTLEEFTKKVKHTHWDNQYAKEYMAAIEMAKVRLTREDCYKYGKEI